VRYHQYNCDYATVHNASALMWSYYRRLSADTCVKPLSTAQCELCVSTRLSRPRQSWLLLQLIKALHFLSWQSRHLSASYVWQLAHSGCSVACEKWASSQFSSYHQTSGTHNKKHTLTVSPQSSPGDRGLGLPFLSYTIPIKLIQFIGVDSLPTTSR